MWQVLGAGVRCCPQPVPQGQGHLRRRRHRYDERDHPPFINKRRSACLTTTPCLLGWLLPRSLWCQAPPRPSSGCSACSAGRWPGPGTPASSSRSSPRHQVRTKHGLAHHTTAPPSTAFRPGRQAGGGAADVLSAGQLSLGVVGGRCPGGAAGGADGGPQEGGPREAAGRQAGSLGCLWHALPDVPACLPVWCFFNRSPVGSASRRTWWTPSSSHR